MSDEKSTRQARIDEIKARRRAENIAAEWLPQLASALDVDESMIRLLSIEETAANRQRIVHQVREMESSGSEHVHVWELRDEAVAVGVLKSTLNGLRVVDAVDSIVIYHDVDKCIGGALVPFDNVRRSPVAVWKCVRQDLLISTQDVASGVLFGHSFVVPDKPYTSSGYLELCRWGVFGE